MPGMRTTGDASHSVGFFSETGPLVERVAAFLEQGLRGNDAAILVATADHRVLVERVLAENGIDLDGARARGQYVFLDAAQTLASLLEAGSPSRSRFNETVGSVLAEAQSKYMRVRIYGEMVSLLWLEGKSGAAIALEGIWNEVIGDRLSLLCGYMVAALGHSANELDGIAALHTDIVEPGHGRSAA